MAASSPDFRQQALKLTDDCLVVKFSKKLEEKCGILMSIKSKFYRGPGLEVWF